MTRRATIERIASRRARMVYDGEVQYQGWMDAYKINEIAEIYGGTFTQAWDEVRVATKQHLKTLMVDNW